VNTESHSEFFQKGKNEMNPNFRNEMFLVGFAFVSISLANPAPIWADSVSECGDQKPEISLAACTQIIASNKYGANKKWEVFKNRGIAFRVLKNDKLAIADYNQAIAIYPQDEKYYYDRGVAFAKHGDIRQARIDYESPSALKRFTLN
jgi:tetratricopeptide (TPR) repeat protein